MLIVVEVLCQTPFTSSGVNLQLDAESSTELPSHVSPNASFSLDGDKLAWRPLLLIVPLRLGLSSINEIYIPSLKVSL